MSNNEFKIFTSQQLSTLIEDARKYSDIRQQTMASRLRTTQQSYSRIERNIGLTKVETLMTVLAALDLELVIRPNNRFNELIQKKEEASKVSAAKPVAKKEPAPIPTRREGLVILGKRATDVEQGVPAEKSKPKW